MLQDKDGNFLLPTAANIIAAAAAGAGNLPANLAAPLIYEPGPNSYPITNFEYLVVQAKQANAATAQAIRDFLTFAMDPNGGSAAALLQGRNPPSTCEQAADTDDNSNGGWASAGTPKLPIGALIATAHMVLY